MPSDVLLPASVVWFLLLSRGFCFSFFGFVPVYFVFGPFRWFEGEKRMVNLGDPPTKQASNRPLNKAVNTQINCDAILLRM